MKFNVFFRTVGSSLIVAAILWPPLDKLSFRLLIVIGILIWTIRRCFFYKKKYLSYLIVTDAIIHVQFITPLLKTKTLEVNVPDVNELLLSMDGFWYSALGVLKLKAKESSATFLIISNKVLKTAHDQVTTASGGFKKAGPNFYFSPVKQKASGV